MENWQSYNFVKEIKNLYSEGEIPWKELYLYFRRSTEFENKPHIMIAASSPIPHYELLNKDSI